MNELIDGLESLIVQIENMAVKAGRGDYNDGRRVAYEFAADQIRLMLAEYAAIASAPAPGGEVEHRLFDGQWVNIVNSDEVKDAGDDVGEAVDTAVRMTEQQMARNIADNRWPKPRATTPQPPSPISDDSCERGDGLPVAWLVTDLRNEGLDKEADFIEALAEECASYPNEKSPPTAYSQQCRSARVGDACEVLAELCRLYIANPNAMGKYDYVKCVTPRGPRLADDDVGRLWLRAAAIAGDNP